LVAKTKVFLRADGNSRIGLGHIHRLLALGEILSRHFTCIYLIRSPLPGISKLIHASGHQIIDVEGNNDLDELKRQLTGHEIVVLDGYNFNTAYQQEVKEHGCKLVCIDDIHSYHFVSDVLINPAGDVSLSEYSKEPYTKTFFGPAFAMLKKPFREASKEAPINNRETNLLICMGGADPENHTLSALKIGLNFSFNTCYIVLGEAFAHRQSLQNIVDVVDESSFKIEILSNLESSSLAGIMKKTGVAICSASGIAYEYLSVGGELYLRQTAENQSHFFSFLIQNNLAFKLENFRVEPEKVQSATQNRLRIFDGNSDQRILKIFNRLDFELNCKVRRAVPDDLLMLFEWTNEPDLRRQSYNSRPIELEEHTSWFMKKISDSSDLLFIFAFKNILFAQVRFDVNEYATISYSLDKNYRGRGWGELVLQKAIELFYQQRDSSIAVVGYVKKENEGSKKIFLNLGFAQMETIDYPNSYRYEYKKI